MAYKNPSAPSTHESTHNNTPRLPRTTTAPTKKDSMQIFWSYTAVQHSNHVAVHRAAYRGETLVTVAPTPETLTDVSTEHLTDFLSQAMVGIVNKPTIDEATFQRVFADYTAICAQEQAALQAEEMATA
jgi:hypothetical protein